MSTESRIGEHITQGIWLLISLVLGGVVTWLQTTNSSWVIPVLCGLATTTMLLFLGVLIKVYGQTPFERRVTVKNIEPMLKKWILNFGHAIQDGKKDTNAHFSIHVLCHGDAKRQITIARMNEYDSYLLFVTGREFSQQNKSIYEAMNPVDRAMMHASLQAETHRLGMQAKFGPKAIRQDPNSNGLRYVEIQKLIAIRPNLREMDVIETLSDVDSANMLVGILAQSIMGNIIYIQDIQKGIVATPSTSHTSDASQRTDQQEH